jgi:hypothetical protein
MLYLSLREVLIRNASGTHDQIVPADEPTFVIPLLHDAANAAGCVPCDEDGNVVRPGKTPDKAGAPAPAAETADVGVIGYTIEDVVAAVEGVIAQNNKTDFGVTGRPKVGPVAKLLGHKPSADEIDQAWNLVQG